MSERQKYIFEFFLGIVPIAFIVYLFVTGLWDFYSQDAHEITHWKHCIVFATGMGIIIPFFQKKSPSSPQ